MEPLIVSALMVALAEMGDKTQLLTLCLICRFHRPWPIISGIFAATILNHAGAAFIGAWLTQFVGNEVLRWIVGLSFIAMAGWVLIPDKENDVSAKRNRMGVFVTTFIAFFMAEMGDKTQIATVALAAKYHAFFMVVAGSTLGIMLANVPVVFFGKKIITLVPMNVIHRVVAALFLLLGVAVLLGDRIGI